jgi:6-phosphogluconolactonase
MSLHRTVTAVWNILLLCALANAQATRPGLRPDLPDRLAMAQPAAQGHVYVGTYTGSKSKGIYVLLFDSARGTLKDEGLAVEVASPSFLATDSSGRFLYAVGEIADFAGKKSGAVSAFAVAPGSGRLTLLNRQPSGGVGPCHLSIDRRRANVLVANYASGSVAVLPIQEDGRLGAPTSIVQHEGSGPNPKRQERPHAHSINLDSAERFAWVPDLGTDRVFAYRFDSRGHTLARHDPPAVSLRPGSGPRHLAFHPGGRFAYVNGEMASSVTAFTYDADSGTLKEIQTLSTLPGGFEGENTTAEVQVHSSGRFLYVSNRGHDSIAIFAIDPATGLLTAIGHEPTQGKTPRNFTIDPTGTWLLAANQNSDSVVAFRVDHQTGRLRPTGAKAEVPSPVCICFLPAVP